MQFNGFQVFPCGNAVLSVVNNVLTVSGISNSGLDGVLINVQGHNNYTVNFGSLQTIAQNNGVLKTSSLVRNAFGMVTPLYETFKWFDAPSQKIVAGYNSSLLPASYQVYGKLNGQQVFSIDSKTIQSPDPNFPPPNPPSPQAIFWVIAGVVVAAIGIGVTIWATLHTKTTTTTTYNYDANGHFTGSTVSTSEDPNPFQIQVNGDNYTVTEYGITYDANLPSELIGLPSIEAHPVGEQITGYNLSSFQITSIQAL